MNKQNNKVYEKQDVLSMWPIPRSEKRKSVVISVKLSPREKEFLDEMRGNTPTSKFLREQMITYSKKINKKYDGGEKKWLY